MEIAALGNETRAGRSFGNIVVLRVRKRLDVLRVRFYGRGFDVHIRVGMMCVHQANMIEEKLIAAG